MQTCATKTDDIPALVVVAVDITIILILIIIIIIIIDIIITIVMMVIVVVVIHILCNSEDLSPDLTKSEELKINAVRKGSLFGK